MSHKYDLKEIIFRVENVNLSFGEKKILTDVCFEIPNVTRPDCIQGQIVALVGRSGVGKTQLFKILSGLNKPDSGTVTINADLHPVKAGEVGIVPQNYILFNHRTIYDNLKLGITHSNQKMSKSEKDEMIKEYAKNFDLTDHLSKYPMQLSGGQRQRVSIIQQVLTGNRFILLDEPFSGLDMLMIDKVIELLVKVSTLHEHNTLIIVSHDITNALAISDTAFILAKKKENEGARVTEKIDLMELGLAWESDIKNKKTFQELVSHIKEKI